MKLALLLLLFFGDTTAPSDALMRSAVVSRVIDGDTFQATVDLGYNVKVEARCRVLGYDAPEITGSERPEGLSARDALSAKLLPAPVFVIGGKHQDKYGRWLVEVRLADGSNPIPQ